MTPGKPKLGRKECANPLLTLIHLPLRALERYRDMQCAGRAEKAHRWHVEGTLKASGVAQSGGGRGGGGGEREREREREFRLQMVYCILAIGPYTNRNTKQNYAHT